MVMMRAGWIPRSEEKKMLKVSTCAAVLTIAMAFAPAAQAAPPDFCRDYATAAVRQVEAARSIPACNRGAGPRWTTDYRLHFDWCLGANPAAVEAERAARTNWLRACRG
jgi:hypothetical protein